jgi:hypothetical protein
VPDLDVQHEIVSRSAKIAFSIVTIERNLQVLHASVINETIRFIHLSTDLSPQFLFRSLIITASLIHILRAVTLVSWRRQSKLG